MDKVLLKASKRDVSGKKVKVLRREGKLPAIIYGAGVDKPVAITLDLRETGLTLRGVGSSSVIVVDVDGKEYNTLLRDRQRNVILGNYTHLDFLAISLTETVRTSVALVLEGVSPARKELDALLILGVDSIEVEALPGDLMDNISVDISSIKEFGDGIYVRDLALPASVTCLSNLDDMIVVATAPALVTAAGTEEELDEFEGGVEPEIIEKGKKEDEDEE
ncbi:MAG: 50S ribosomal protein L25 [Anaerolineae bacterium]|nr:50S ribosomal protein L25 [Anaerolineae bacterium]